MHRDESYLMHILVAARKILQKTASVTYEQFLEDENLQDSVILQIATISEVAQGRLSLPRLRWARICERNAKGRCGGGPFARHRQKLFEHHI